jgi:magnesium transporter
MRKEMKRRVKKAGLPPGSLVYTGDRPAGAATITVMHYDDAGFHEATARSVDECVPYRDRPGVTWINVEGVHDVTTVQRLGDCFGLHPLVQEDVVNTVQRPKAEDYGDYLYLVLSMLTPDGGTGPVQREQVSLVLGKNFLLSFQEGREGDVFGPIRERIRSGAGKLRKSGTDGLAYALIDAIVDGYFVVIEKFGERIEETESLLMAEPTTAVLQRIYGLKKEMIALRSSVWPLREVVASLSRGDSPLITGTVQTYLRDVYDHTVQVIETIETSRDMVSGMLDLYVSTVSNRLNEVMKVLTIIATIFMPLTFLAGIYGMNFRHMPELEWVWGYPAAVVFMIAVAGGMVVFFRKKNWL